jgi:acetolactate synthase-1/2/3 large subunit
MNFPANHPLSGGYNAQPYLGDADVLLVIDHDLPFVPSRTRLKPGVKVLYIDIDPLKINMPLWNFPVDVRIQADSGKVLPVLNRMLREKINTTQKKHAQARAGRIKAEHDRMLEEARQLAISKASQKPLSVDWICHSLFELLDEDALILIEAVTSTFALLRQLSRSKPGTLFQSRGSSLGWAPGAAIGAKLAAPDKTVVTLMGDGAFVFGCPVAALWGAVAHNAPFLSIIFNNARYNAPRSALRGTYQGASYSERTGVWVGSDIVPSPDYAAVARACHAWGQVVEEPGDVAPAIKAALEQVHNGTTAVLDMRVESY